MSKDAGYHEAAIEYNRRMAEEAEKLVEETEDLVVKGWCRSIAKQHRYHEGKHLTSLDRLNNPEKYPKPRPARRRVTSQMQKAELVKARNEHNKNVISERRVTSVAPVAPKPGPPKAAVEFVAPAAPTPAHDTTGERSADAQPVDAAVDTTTENQEN